jgi:hypothetical protein
MCFKIGTNGSPIGCFFFLAINFLKGRLTRGRKNPGLPVENRYAARQRISVIMQPHYLWPVPFRRPMRLIRIPAIPYNSVPVGPALESGLPSPSAKLWSLIRHICLIAQVLVRTCLGVSFWALFFLPSVKMYQELQCAVLQCHGLKIGERRGFVCRGTGAVPLLFCGILTI